MITTVNDMGYGLIEIVIIDYCRCTINCAYISNLFLSSSTIWIDMSKQTEEVPKELTFSSDAKAKECYETIQKCMVKALS